MNSSQFSTFIRWSSNFLPNPASLRNCLVETSHHHTFQNPFANIELDGFPYYCRFAIFCFSFALQSAPQFGADTVAYKTSPETAPMGVRNRFPGLDWVNFPTSRMMILPIHALLFNSIEIFKAAVGRLLLHLSGSFVSLWIIAGRTARWV